MQFPLLGASGFLRVISAAFRAVGPVIISESTFPFNKKSGPVRNFRSLTTLDVSGFDTSDVTTMRSMFANCRHPTSINPSGLSIGKVKAMTGMFSGCASVPRSAGWDIADNVTMRSLFFRCRSLIHLDLTGLNPSRIRDKDFMFAEYESLADLKWDGFADADDTCMFLDCPLSQAQGS